MLFKGKEWETQQITHQRKKKGTIHVCVGGGGGAGGSAISLLMESQIPELLFFFFLHWSSFLVTLEKNSLTEIKGTTVYNTVVSVHSQTCATITTDFSAFWLSPKETTHPLAATLCSSFPPASGNH